MVASRRLSAILAADVAGYSRLIGIDEEGTLDRLKAHRRDLLDPTIRHYRGRIVNTAGDAVLAEFASVVDAVRCALDTQRAIIERDAGLPEDRQIRFRIGINLGDVIVDGSDILGDGVNIAARLQALAEPGGICISGTVYDQVRDRLPVEFQDSGEQRVHNIARPVRTFKLGRDAIAALPPLPPPAAAPPPRRRSALVAALAAILIVIAAGGLWLWARPVPSGSPKPGISTAAPGSPAGTAPRLSIVVLPFNNLSSDPGQEYLADGITEDLTTDLSRIDDSVVISRNTAFTYKGKAIEAKQLGRELNVRYVLEGSVRRSGDQVRINVQLVDAESGVHLWAERFDRDNGELSAVENDIIGRVARAVRAQLISVEAGRKTDHPDAREYVLRGRAALVKPVSRAASDEALAMFEQALALDPSIAAAQTGLASALVSRVLDEFSGSPTVDLQRAEELLGRALATSPRSSWPHYVRGQLLRAQGRCQDAIPEYEAAIAIDRNSAPSYAWLGWCKLLSGEVEKVIPLEEQAIRLSPQDRAIAGWYGRIGMAHLLQRRYDEAITWLEKSRSRYAADGRTPTYVHSWLASAYALKGDEAAARTELKTASALGLHPSISALAADPWYQHPKFRALAEATYFVGLRQAGMRAE
jgi:adenylate cyclase